MAEIIDHPSSVTTDSKPWDFPDGGSILITAGEGKPLTVMQAIYMLEDVKFRILKMMYEP